MTCIVGMISKGGIGHIASDSIGSNGHNKSNYKNKKIFQTGEMLIGYTSSYRMGQLLEHSLVLPERKVNQTIDKYMYVDFIAAVRKLFKDNGYLKISENREEIGEFIIITEGRIFKMQDDLSLLESGDDFDAVGSGQDYAIATMHVMTTLIDKEAVDTKTILKTAVDTAARYVATVGGEVQYMTDGKQ